MTQPVELKAGMMNGKRTIAVHLYFKWYAIVEFSHDKHLNKAIDALRAIENVKVSRVYGQNQTCNKADLEFQYDIIKQHQIIVRLNRVFSKTIVDNLSDEQFSQILKVLSYGNYKLS